MDDSDKLAKSYYWILADTAFKAKDALIRVEGNWSSTLSQIVYAKKEVKKWKEILQKQLGKVCAARSQEIN